MWSRATAPGQAMYIASEDDHLWLQSVQRSFYVADPNHRFKTFGGSSRSHPIRGSRLPAGVAIAVHARGPLRPPKPHLLTSIRD
jgi:hypothetical protein